MVRSRIMRSFAAYLLAYRAPFFGRVNWSTLPQPAAGGVLLSKPHHNPSKAFQILRTSLRTVILRTSFNPALFLQPAAISLTLPRLPLFRSGASAHAAVKLTTPIGMDIRAFAGRSGSGHSFTLYAVQIVRKLAQRRPGRAVKAAGLPCLIFIHALLVVCL